MTTWSKTTFLAAAMVVIAAAMVAAQPSADCATKLTPCSQFLNSTNPPKECCDSLSNAITNDLKCLCNLYSSGVLNSIGINVTQALQLPKRCGIDGDLSGCTNSNGTSTTKTPSSLPPPPPSGGNGAGRESWTGILSVLLLICALTMAF